MREEFPKHYFATMPATEFYETTRMNWTVNVICEGLAIRKREYSKIYAAIAKTIGKSGLLGTNCNTLVAQEQLKLDCAEVEGMFPDVFRDIPVAWKGECLRRIAYKANNNIKRHVTQRDLPLRPLSADQELSVSQPRMAEQEAQRLSDRRALGDFTVRIRRPNVVEWFPFSVRDLHPKGKVDLEVADIEWLRMVHILTAKVGYDVRDDILCWRFADGAKGTVSCDMSLRTAVTEMSANRVSVFSFEICKRGNYTY